MEQVWMFERLAISLERVDFLDPALADEDDVRERGVRLEVRLTDTDRTGTIYASASRRLRPAVCRIDLLESAPYAADRMHWHPVMEDGEPGPRTFDVTMVEDPLQWLDQHLRRIARLLDRSGVATKDYPAADVDAVREAGPDIVAAAADGLVWARQQPCPDVTRDDRGLGHERAAPTPEVVSFTTMADGTAADYELLDRIEAVELAKFPDRVLGWLRTLAGSDGYQVTRLDHSLQAATRAHRAGEDEETVVCALLHDLGDHLAPANHSEVAAAMLRPYVSARNYWVLKHHGLFQGYYYFHFYGQDRNARDRYQDHEHFQATVDFCAVFDQPSFDPSYDAEPLGFFEPMVRRVLHPDRRKDPFAA